MKIEILQTNFSMSLFSSLVLMNHPTAEKHNVVSIFNHVLEDKPIDIQFQDKDT